MNKIYKLIDLLAYLKLLICNLHQFFKQFIIYLQLKPKI